MPKEIIKNVMDKVDINLIFAVAWMFSAIITFLPRKLIAMFSMTIFKQKYQFVISLILIAVGSYFVIIAITPLAKFVKSKVMLKNTQFNLRKQLHHLSHQEQETLMTFYDPKTSKFELSSELERNKAVTLSLEEKGIIATSNISVDCFTFSYYLQSCALNELNIMLQNEAIKVKVEKINRLGAMTTTVTSFIWNNRP